MKEMNYIFEVSEDDRRSAIKTIGMMGHTRDIKTNMQLILMGIENLYITNLLKDQHVVIDGQAC